MREDDRVQSMAVVIAYGIRGDGVREVFGLEVTPSEDLEHWAQLPAVAGSTWRARGEAGS
ncbi:MAG: transposase [Anaerolineae bacterium]